MMMHCHFRGVLSRFQRKIANVLTKVSFLSSSSNVIPSMNVPEALSCIKNKLDDGNKTHIFIGTGQYYSHKTNERVIALSLGKSNSLETPLEILDAGIPSEDLQKLEKEIGMLSNCSLVSGEVDSVYEEPWSFGFSNNPQFSIFSKFGYCLTVTKLKAGPAFRVYNGPLCEEIYLRNIQDIQVRLSEQPWEERKLEVKLKDGEILTVVEDLRPNGSVDLGELMVSTEWMVKAAGHMCLFARVVGNCKDVLLKLPNPLRAENNPWIELRNKTWIERVEDKKDI
ncbi:uncharacterized protein LOC110251255 [Exaiptasia diaphana]|uniref:Uncharacterized protein n=1 Tax=Exaiptasia diaphana TaxID=2652724 RepID=A0A913Y273_EXADI|nr:uncharacterized protein LOC110251255 [Exaiptasia diaphana]